MKSTSENILGLNEAPEYMCSRIDNVIAIANKSENLASDIQKHDEDDIKQIHEDANDIEWEVSNIPSTMEELRTTVEELRAWGQNWKDKAKELLDEYEEGWREQNG